MREESKKAKYENYHVLEFDPYKTWDEEYLEDLKFFSSLVVRDEVQAIKRNLEKEAYNY